MTKKELVEWLETDPSAVDVVALKFARSKDMAVVEMSLEVPPGSIEDVLSEFPDIQLRFNKRLQATTSDMAKRTLCVGVRDALDTLQEVFLDEGTDTKSRSQAATTFLTAWMKLNAQNKNNKDKSEDESIDDIIKAIKQTK